MSLFRQLWLSVACLMTTAFFTSFLISSIAAKNYLEEQLYEKNVDTASSLALTLASLASDETELELYISSIFDTGHYQYILLKNGDGRLVVARNHINKNLAAPDWLRKLFPIKPGVGVAQVSSGWRQIGTLYVASDTEFAYHQLWQGSKQLMFYFVIIVLAGGIVGSMMLRLLIHPLHTTVKQAQAISERRFITVAEPKTKEFKELVHSMNQLSSNVKSMLDNETAKLEKIRQEHHHDSVTGLMTRDIIMTQLTALLNTDDAFASGSVVLLRIHDLFGLNQKEGHREVDILLQEMGKSLLSESLDVSPGLGIAGRLNGSDFLVILPGKDNLAKDSCQVFQQLLSRVCLEEGFNEVSLFAISSVYHAGETSSDVMIRLDQGLKQAAEDDSEPYVFVESEQPEIGPIKKIDWEKLISLALKEKRFAFEYFPTLNADRSCLHWEAPIRMIQEDGQIMYAGQFMPHIIRLEYGANLDLVVLEMALEAIEQRNEAIGINLSTGILTDAQSLKRACQIISRKSEVAHLLWLEIPEYSVFHHLEAFRDFALKIQNLPCHLGIEHVGREIIQFGKLHDLGLEFIKVDRALISGIDRNLPNQILLRGLATIVQSIGLKAIAEGVNSEQEWEMVIDLGFDGGTGPYCTKAQL